MISPKELIQHVQLAVVKARSNAAESDLVEIGGLVDPLIFGDGDMSLLNITEKILEGGREPSVQDAYNVLVLIELQSPAFVLMYFMRWDEKLPDSMEYLQAGMNP